MDMLKAFGCDRTVYRKAGQRERALRHRLRDFWGARRGAILVEAAIVLPLLVMLFLGMVEFSTAFTAQRRVAAVSSTVADLVSQTATVTASDLADIVNVANSLMPPYRTAPLKVVISSVGTDASGAISVLWSYASNGGGALSVGAPYSLPSGVISGTGSIVVVQAQYTYTPTLSSFLVNGVTLQSKSYYRPRVGTFVTKD